MGRLLCGAAVVYALVWMAVTDYRHRTVPVALEPHCTIWRIHHSDPRRRTRIVNDCYPLDTTFVPR